MVLIPCWRLVFAGRRVIKFSRGDLVMSLLSCVIRLVFKILGHGSRYEIFAMNARLVHVAGVVLLGLGFSPLAAGGGAAAYLKKPDHWFGTAEGRRITANVLTHQSELGGWAKNSSTVIAPHVGERSGIQATFDNGATVDELRLLARAFNGTRDEALRVGFIKGLDYVLVAQYPSGGWPQFYPPGKQYERHITFNDGVMVRVLEFLREVSLAESYAFVPAALRVAAGEAFENGIACVLKCQIVVDGKPTVWCAQHDEVDFSPRPARAYELASFSGSESVGITRLLMSIERPRPEVIGAVEGAVAWFDAVKIAGIRLEQRTDSKLPENGENLVVVKDAAAPLLWARFYDLGSQKPVFCDRDGVPRALISEISHERRNGYRWYGTWPQSLLEKDYPAWKLRVGR